MKQSLSNTGRKVYLIMGWSGWYVLLIGLFGYFVISVLAMLEWSNPIARLAAIISFLFSAALLYRWCDIQVA